MVLKWDGRSISIGKYMYLMHTLMLPRRASIIGESAVRLIRFHRNKV